MGPCLILKECARVLAQQSRPWPDWEPQSPWPVGAASGTGSLAGQRQAVTEMTIIRSGMAGMGQG